MKGRGKCSCSEGRQPDSGRVAPWETGLLRRVLWGVTSVPKTFKWPQTLPTPSTKRNHESCSRGRSSRRHSRALSLPFWSVGAAEPSERECAPDSGRLGGAPPGGTQNRWPWVRWDGAVAGSLGVSMGEGGGWRSQVIAFRRVLVVSRLRNYKGEEEKLS